MSEPKMSEPKMSKLKGPQMSELKGAEHVRNEGVEHIVFVCQGLLCQLHHRFPLLQRKGSSDVRTEGGKGPWMSDLKMEEVLGCQN